MVEQTVYRERTEIMFALCCLSIADSLLFQHYKIFFTHTDVIQCAGFVMVIQIDSALFCKKSAGYG